MSDLKSAFDITSRLRIRLHGGRSYNNLLIHLHYQLYVTKHAVMFYAIQLEGVG